MLFIFYCHVFIYVCIYYYYMHICTYLCRVCMYVRTYVYVILSKVTLITNLCHAFWKVNKLLRLTNFSLTKVFSKDLLTVKRAAGRAL